MIKKFSALLFTAALLFSIHSVAQRPRTIEADGAFAKGDYYDAIDLYKKAYSKESDKEGRAEIIFKTAECYRMVNDAKNQEVWYDKAIKAEYKDNIAILRLADALKFQGKYDEAMAKYAAATSQPERIAALRELDALMTSQYHYVMAWTADFTSAKPSPYPSPSDRLLERFAR